MVQFRVLLILHLELYLKVHFKIYIKMHKNGAPENAISGAVQVALKLHLFVQLPMHKSISNDSIKGEIEEARYAALEGASKISFCGVPKTA